VAAIIAFSAGIIDGSTTILLLRFPSGLVKLPGSLKQISLTDDIIVFKHRARFVVLKRHGYSLRDAGTNKVTDCGSPTIIRDPPGKGSGVAGSEPRSPGNANRTAKTLSGSLSKPEYSR
jgi:hypothetical protein